MAQKIVALVFVVLAITVMLAGELTFFERFVCILLGNILMAIRERDA